MGLIGSGRITPLGGAKVVRLSSASDTFEVKDSDGFPLFKIDGNGDMSLRGKVKRI